MAASFPGSVRNFGADRVNGEYIPASDMNGVREEVVAMQTSFLTSGPIRIVGGTARLGGLADYTQIEADGTIRYVGGATVYKDIVLPLVPKTTGPGSPTLASFWGNIRKYQMAINDVGDLDTSELMHEWMEGTPIEIHVHWTTSALNNATVRGVKFEIDYTWANIQSAGGQTAFPAQTTVSLESSIAAAEPDRTHKYMSVTTFTPVGGKIGAALLMSIKRIASVTNVAPATDPFILMVGAHIQCDTPGSRTTAGK